MSVVRSDEVRPFIISHLAGSFRENNLAEEEIADDFDLMKMGIIDSIGFLALLSAIEKHFAIEVDFEDMDTENLTVIGSICKYIEERAVKESNDI
jgi:acyl carrier protein